MPIRWPTIAPLFVCLASATGCKSNGPRASAPAGVAVASLTVTSSSFPQGGTIPVDHTCSGAEKSPPVAWSAPPPGTKSFALMMVDPDASGGDLIHWIVVNLPGDALSIPEAVDVSTLGATSGINGLQRAGYSGPCPPRLEIHHYVFRIFALDAPLDVGPSADGEAVDAAMHGHVLAAGALVGTFSR